MGIYLYFTQNSLVWVFSPECECIIKCSCVFMLLKHLFLFLGVSSLGLSCVQFRGLRFVLCQDSKNEGKSVELFLWGIYADVARTNYPF